MFEFLKNLLKTSNDAQIKKLQKTVDQINALEGQTKQLSDEQMRGKIAELRRMGYRGEIEADGGINEQNLPRLIEKGLSVAVMGTALFHAADPAEMMARLHAMGAGVPEK